MNPRSAVGGLLLVVGLVVLALAAYVAWGAGGSAGPTPVTISSPLATPWPTFTPYVPATVTALQTASLRVSCNAYAVLTLVDSRTGEEADLGSCSPLRKMEWPDLHPGVYVLRATCPDLEAESDQEVTLEAGENETAMLFPGVLVIQPIPETARVEVDGKVHYGLTRMTYPAEQCPLTVTVWVLADGYVPYGVDLRILAGQVHQREIALEAGPTPVPPPSATARPTRRPVTAAPTTPPWTVDERVALVRQKLYESVNCIRAENGLAPLPYVSEWQALADDFARGWRDHFLQYGPSGFDAAPWRQQFQVAGGDAVTDRAGLVLYAPDYYVNTAPFARWETFSMCDPNCPAYHYFWERAPELRRASGVVIGLVPWWDGDVLKAAVAIGVKW